MPVAPHIARLRAHIGHDLLLLPSVAVLPVDPRGRVLLVRQTDFGAFATIGGAVDEDESPADAARRELLEETGLQMGELELIAAIGGPEFRISYPNGDQVAYVSTVYVTRVQEKLVATPDEDEVDAVGWFTREELVDPVVGAFALNTFRAIGWIS
jgi:ADP-ribose pyrophosphatase YjhB (NUDIX family)